MEDRRYSLQDLTEEAGVSARTVRYYIAEGLLPPPVQAGARSYYTQSQLDRLRLIGLLKDAFLPLKEIRRRLASLSDDDLRQALADAEEEQAVADVMVSHDASPPAMPAAASLRAGPPARQARMQEDTALDYINRVLGDRPERRAPIVPPAPAFPPHHTPPLDHDRAWRRLAISDGAELMIADDLYLRRKERIDSLIEWARRMLTQD